MAHACSFPHTVCTYVGARLQAGVHPEQPCRTVTRAVFDRLWHHSVALLQRGSWANLGRAGVLGAAAGLCWAECWALLRGIVAGLGAAVGLGAAARLGKLKTHRCAQRCCLAVLGEELGSAGLCGASCANTRSVRAAVDVQVLGVQLGGAGCR